MSGGVWMVKRPDCQPRAGDAFSRQSSSAFTRASWASSSTMPMSWVTRAMAAMSRVGSIFHTASIAAGTSVFLAARLGSSSIHSNVASSNYPVFKGPATL
jgi:hypothetical protein